VKYEIIRKSAIYTFIVVTVAMTLLGVIAIWFPDLEDVISKAFATVLVVGFGCVVIAYASSLLEPRSEEKESLPSFAPHPKPVPPPPRHMAQGE
jgi:predicted membrane channel-forming protein YqfA (hemolysin III family)